MTNGKQLQMIMRDMLFITWAVEPERVRKLVSDRLELDTKTDSTGLEAAFVSAVCFRVTEVRSSALPLVGLSFEQVNYRAYVRAGEVPAVCFLDMKLNSRMVRMLTSFLRVPVNHEDIEINTTASDIGGIHYAIRSAGLRADAVAGEASVSADTVKITPAFITERLVGYAEAGEGVFKIEVAQPGLDSISARVVRVEAPRLEQLGLLTPEQSARPHSALYVREASFGADTPTREW